MSDFEQWHADNACRLSRERAGIAKAPPTPREEAPASESNAAALRGWQPVRAVHVLRSIKACLEAENKKATSAIVDTIWLDDYTTLFDFLDAEIEVAAALAVSQPAKGEAAPAAREGDALVLTQEEAFDVRCTLKHARAFILSREKMHPEGVRLFDEVLAKMDAWLGLALASSALTPKEQTNAD